MSSQSQTNSNTAKISNYEYTKFNAQVFSKDYVEFLNEAGWKLEKKFPSNINNYSELLEDTDWKSNISDLNSSKHYRRDLDALS